MRLGIPFTAPWALGTSAPLPDVPTEHPTQPPAPYSSCRAKSPPKTPLGRSVILLPYSTLGEKGWCERDRGAVGDTVQGVQRPPHTPQCGHLQGVQGA